MASDKQSTHESTPRAALLDDDGDLTDAFMQALRQTFDRFSAQARGAVSEAGKVEDRAAAAAAAAAAASSSSSSLAKKEKAVVMMPDELDAFARTVNDGAVMSDEEKAELREYFDVDAEGNLTFTGFCEMYHLQSSSAEDETWKDLHKLGFNDKLEQAEEKAAK